MNELNFQKFLVEMNLCASLVLDIKLALYDGDNSTAYKKLSLLNKKQLEIFNAMIEQHFNPNYEFDFPRGPNDMEDLPFYEKNPPSDAEIEKENALPSLNEEVVQFDIYDFLYMLRVF